MTTSGDGSLAVTSIVGLEPLDQFTNESHASDINDLGQVVGWSLDVGVLLPVVWDGSVFPEALPLPVGSTEGTANAINNTGTIVGRSNFAGGTFATRWVRLNGAWSALRLVPVPLDVTYEEATDVSDDGTIVGYSVTAAGTRGFLWQSGVRTDLGPLGIKRVDGVSSSGQAAGQTVDNIAMVWSPANGVTVLGTLGGVLSYANDINASNEVAGTTLTGAGQNRAFFWTRKKGMTELGTLGGTESFGNAISGAGQVVGSSTTSAAGVQHAALWAKGKTLDLGVLPGYEVSAAHGINNTGQVIGVSAGGSYVRPTKWTVK